MIAHSPADNGRVSPNGSAVNDQEPARVVMRRADGDPIHVLVVDDEPVLAELVSMALRYEGWEIVTAGDGASAIALARQTPPDVVVLDVMLPDMSGLDVLHKLREQIPGLPLLLLTAKDSVEDRIAGLTAGGDDYVTKPFSLEEVVLRLRALLRRTGVTSESGGAKIVVGDLVLDEDSHEVTRAGELITLTATEFELLRFMMRNSKRVLSKAQILDRVWSYDFGGRSNIVELYVSYLRKKIDSRARTDDPYAARCRLCPQTRTLNRWVGRGCVHRARGHFECGCWFAGTPAGPGVRRDRCRHNVALQHFLTNQLDDRLAETGRRSAGLFEFGPPPPPPRFSRAAGLSATDDHPRRLGPGPAFLNAPGQAARTVGAVISRGTPVDAGVITADGSRSRDQSRRSTTTGAIEPHAPPTTIELDGLGRYRVIAMRAHGPGETIVTGLPTSDVDDTLLTVAVIFSVVGVMALIGGTDGGDRDHPAPTRAAFNGFRGGTAGGRPGTRPRRGPAAHADRRGGSGGRAHRDRATGFRAEPDARPHLRRVVRPARQ